MVQVLVNNVPVASYSYDPFGRRVSKTITGTGATQVPAPLGTTYYVYADEGLVKNVPPYRIFREKRNITSHTYDEAKAQEVVAILQDFLVEMNFLLNELKRRNS